MSELREKLLDRMIRMYGMEHEIVISFAKLCETWDNGGIWDEALETLVKAHEEFPQIEDEDEE